MLNTEKVYNYLQKNEIEKLKEYVRLELLTNDKKSSIKAGITTYYKHIEKINQSRAILQFCKTIDGIQYTTDTYIGLALVEEDHIKLFKEIEETEKFHYPDLKKVINYHTIFDCEKDFEVLDLMNKIKVAIAEDKFLFFKNCCVNYVDPKKLKLVLQGLQADGTLHFNFKDRAIIIEKANGSKAILLPAVAKDDENIDDIVITIE